MENNERIEPVNQDQNSGTTPSGSFCGKCGRKVDVETGACPVCDKIEQTRPEIGGGVSDAAGKEKQRKERIIRVAGCILIAIITLISFELAGSLIAQGGANISDIKSVGGRTLEEAYYQELGIVYNGISIAVRAFGRVLTFLLVYMGWMEWRKDK